MSNPIIITGASGFIARHLLPLLVGTGRPIVAVDREVPRKTLPFGVRFHRSDLSEPADLVPSDLDLSNGFCLIHLAWDMRRGAEFGPQVEPVRMLAQLLDYWGEHGLTRLVGLGSAEEYGSRCGLIHEYDPPLDPLSPYGAGKQMAWLLARSWGMRGGHSVIWLRPFIVYGPGQRGAMVLPYAMEQLRQGAEATFSDGLQERDFIHVTDVARAISLAVECPFAGVHAVNLGCGTPVQVREAVMNVARMAQAEKQFKWGVRNRRAGEPDRQVAATSMAQELLNWTPEIGWKDGLADWFRCDGNP